MKKAILLVFIVLFNFSGYAQSNDNQLLGKWKIVTFDAMLYHDYRNDSTHYPPELLESLKDNKDSAFMVGFLDGMISSFKNYYYEFQAKDKFLEIKNGSIKQNGTFTINKKEKTILLTVKDKSGGEKRQTLLYELKDDHLLLSIPSDEMPVTIGLVKE